MNSRAGIAIIVLALALLALAWLSVFLYQRGQEYYLELNATRLDPFGLNAFPSSTKQTQQPVVVFFGDSRAAAWPAPDQIKHVTFVNRGIVAQTTAQILGRFQQHIASLKPQVIVFQAGMNDLKTIPLFPEKKETIIQNCKANIGQIIKLSLATGARVVVTTIFPSGMLPIERRPFWSDDIEIARKDVNAYLETLASNRVIIFDSGKVLANSEGIVDHQFSRNFLHLNSAGYAALNEAIADILAP